MITFNLLNFQQHDNYNNDNMNIVNNNNNTNNNNNNVTTNNHNDNNIAWLTVITITPKNTIYN